MGKGNSEGMCTHCGGLEGEDALDHIFMSGHVHPTAACTQCSQSCRCRCAWHKEITRNDADGAEGAFVAVGGSEWQAIHRAPSR